MAVARLVNPLRSSTLLRGPSPGSASGRAPLVQAQRLSSSVLYGCGASVVLMLAPIVPHAAHAMWEGLGHADPIVDHAWPEADPDALVRDTVELVVQVNGKVRGRVSVDSGADQAAIEAEALANENVQRFTEDKTIRKTIIVPGKLVNIVV